MAEPDPKPQVEAIAAANGLGPPKDSGAEAVQVSKQGEELKGVQELKVPKENNVVAEKEEAEVRNDVEETTDGIENKEYIKAKNNSGETAQGGEEDDVKETNDIVNCKEIKGENGINEMNCLEETKGGEDKISMKDTNNEKDMKEVEEKMAIEEKQGEERIREKDAKVLEEKMAIEEKQGEGKTNEKDMKELEEKLAIEERQGEEKIKDREENKCLAPKKDEEGKVGTDKRVEGQEEGKGGKVNEDVEVVEADNVKEEDKMSTDERVEVGGKSEGKDDVKDKEDDMDMEKEGDDSKKVKGVKKKRSRSRRKVDEKEEVKEKKEETKKPGAATEKKEGLKKLKEPLTSPKPSSIDRPVRERKIVERLVEVIEKETNKGVVIEKGRGTPLKNIPNVAHKLARKKPGDLKLLHQVLFGRKGKAVDFKNNILQFSGFAWHESDEKQRAKMKERLDKYVKDALIGLCDLLDVSVAKASAKKEDIIVKLLDFLSAPSATTGALFAEKEQDSPKSLKRKRVARGSASKGTEDVVPKKSRKKRMKIEGTLSSNVKAMPDTEDEDEEDKDNENVAPEEDEELVHSERDKESEPEEASEKDEGEEDENSGKDKQDKKKSPKKKNSSKKEEVKVEGSFKKTPSVPAAKSPSKTPTSIRSKSDECNDEGEKVFVRKKSQVDLPKKKSTSRPDIKEKSSGKRGSGSKPKPEGEGQSIPSKEDLRRTICEILKKVDFNMATFTDILKQLATHYKVDLTPRKATVKLMIQEELTKLADEAEENQYGGDSEEEEEEEEEHPKAQGKKVEL